MRFAVIAALPLLLVPAACKDTPDKPAEGRNAANYTAANVAPLAERSADPQALATAFAAAFKTPTVRVGDDQYTFKPAALYRLDDKWVLLAEGIGPDCHACSGWLSVHYLERKPEGFAVTGGWTDAVPGSTYGGAPEWRVRTDLMSEPVIVSEGGGTAQGYTCSVARLTELAPDGPRPRTELIPVGYSDAGAIVDDTAPREVDGAIAEGQRDRSFTVHYTGTVTRDVTYTRKGDMFVAGEGANAIPRC